MHWAAQTRGKAGQSEVLYLTRIFLTVMQRQTRKAQRHRLHSLLPSLAGCQRTHAASTDVPAMTVIVVVITGMHCCRPRT
jgi:hypothetical protein